MMTVGSASGASLQGANGVMQGGGMQTDSVSRNLQNQITEQQRKLKDLSSDENLTSEEKMKKRQEIQQEITNLQQQLRQHQIEQRKEKQSKSADKQEAAGGNGKNGLAKNGKQAAGLSTSSMQAMISADSSVKQAKVQGSVATRMEGRAGVLKAEIKQDGATGGNTEAKEAELADVEQKAMEATASQVNTLANANKTMEEAAKADQRSESDKAVSKAKDEEGEQGNKEEKTDGISGQSTAATGTDTTDRTQETSAAEEGLAPNAVGGGAQPVTYTRVDVRL